MARLEVLTFPDPRLERTATPVEQVDDALRVFIDDLFDTMHGKGGIGLAATQVGDLRRVVVIEVPMGEGECQPRALINPRIIEREGEIIWNEGCLSVPGISADVDRAERIVVEYLDADGQLQRLETQDLEAVCIQHEIDHLDGVLYIDRLGALERESAILDYEAAKIRAAQRIAVKDLRVVFMGTPEFAVPTLEMLFEIGCNVVGVVSQPARKKGRGQKIQQTPVGACAERHEVPVFQWPRLNNSSFAALSDLKPDLCVVVAYGKILPQRYLDLPRFFCLNGHASALPKLRGAAPIQWAVIRGHAEAGVDVMRMDAGMDTGDVALGRRVEIGADETAGELHDRLRLVTAEAMREAVLLLCDANLSFTEQDHDEATMAPMLKKADGILDWSRSAQELHDLTRGTSPWPGAHVPTAKGPLKVHATRVVEGSGTPGTVIALAEDGPIVACGVGAVVLLRLQKPGKKPMNGADFVRGYRVTIGEGIC